MKNNRRLQNNVLFILGLAGCWASACNPPPAVPKTETAQPAPRKTETAETPSPTAKRKELGRNIFLEVDGDKRRVIVNAKVCLTAGFLEHFLTRDEAAKQHESILTADIDARNLHTALELAGAKPGRPVQFFNAKGDEDFKPAAGDVIKIVLQYEDKGKTVTVPAQRWVRSTKTKKELTYDWVFAGSKLFPDPEGKLPPFYGANEGRVICVANFTTALLDLPIKSLEGDPQEGLDYEANSDLIPPLETKVEVILEPVPSKPVK